MEARVHHTGGARRGVTSHDPYSPFVTTCCQPRLAGSASREPRSQHADCIAWGGRACAARAMSDDTRTPATYTVSPAVARVERQVPVTGSRAAHRATHRGIQPLGTHPLS